MAPHRVDHRLVRDPFGEGGMRMRRGNVEQARFDERVDAERHDHRDRDKPASRQMPKLFSTHERPTQERPNRLACVTARTWVTPLLAVRPLKFGKNRQHLRRRATYPRRHDPDTPRNRPGASHPRHRNGRDQGPRPVRRPRSRLRYRTLQARPPHSVRRAARVRRAAAPERSTAKADRRMRRRCTGPRTLRDVEQAFARRAMPQPVAVALSDDPGTM